MGNDAQIIRFMREQNAQLKAENEALSTEVEALRHYIRSLQRFQTMVQRFTPEHDVLELLEQTLDSAMELMDANDGSLLLLDEETDELVFVLVYGAVRETLPGYRFNAHQGIAGWVLDHEEPQIVNNARADKRFLADFDEQLNFETRSLIAVPIIARGTSFGVIEVLNKRSGEPFTYDDADLLSILATLAATALDYAVSAPEEAPQETQ
jgi:GAF domain-containing protein